MSKSTPALSVVDSSCSTTKSAAPTMQRQHVNTGSTTAQVAVDGGKGKSLSSKPTVDSILDVCGKCHGAHGTATHRVVVEIYLLEDLLLTSYYFDLCAYCMRQQARHSKRQRITTRQRPI